MLAIPDDEGHEVEGVRRREPDRADEHARRARGRRPTRTSRRCSRARAPPCSCSGRTSRGVIERIPPTPRQKNDAEKNASTKHAHSCGLGTAAFTTRPTPVDSHPDLRPEEQAPPVDRVRERAAEQRQRHERHELHERERRDRERRAGQLVDLERQRDLHDAAAEVLRGLSEPEPAEGGRLADRREVDREAGEALADARALEARRDVVGAGAGRRSEELGVVGRVRRRLEQPARAPLQVGEVEPALLGALDDPPRERDRVVDDLDVRRAPPGPSRRGSSARCATRRSGRRRPRPRRACAGRPPRSSPRSGSSA